MEDITKSEGRTILFVSHNMGAISQLCNKCILLNEGRIKLIGKTENVIKKYLTTSLQNNYEINEPKHKQFGAYFTKFFLSDSKEDIKNIFKLGEIIIVNSKIKVLSSGIHLISVIHVYNQEGKCLFASSNSHESSMNDKKFEDGLYTLQCIIPEYFFNVGRYYISFILITNNDKIIDRHEQILVFDMINDFTIGTEYKGEWTGLVRPKLHWKLLL